MSNTLRGTLFQGIRQQLGLSQSELAKELKFNRRTLQKWERNCPEPPEYALEYLRMYADGIRIDMTGDNDK